MIVGIDPGQTGGLAYIDTEGASSWAVPMPVAGKEIDGHAIADMLRNWGPDTVYIERVHSMPGQGVASTFKFGMGYGVIIGICDALGLPYRLITPQAWKKRVLAGTAKDKDAAISFVRRAYPHVDLTPGAKRKPHDGIADALCIAEFGRMLMVGDKNSDWLRGVQVSDKQQEKPPERRYVNKPQGRK
jgi:crossover junction endodeoxyribonuclease RuvC